MLRSRYLNLVFRPETDDFVVFIWTANDCNANKLKYPFSISSCYFVFYLSLTSVVTVVETSKFFFFSILKVRHRNDLQRFQCKTDSKRT